MKKIMKNKKIFVFGIVLLIFLLLGLYHFLGSNEDKFIVGKTLKISNPSDYLVQYDNGDYYLMKANADIKFMVSSKDKEIKYQIVDEDNKEVGTKVNKKKKNFEIAPNQNYEAGKTYQLTLENASFTDEKLKDIQTLYFTIVRPNANTQVFNDNVIKVNKETITDVQEDDHYYQITSKKEFKKNDILYYQNKNEYLAFKVNNVTKEDDSYIIETDAPTLEEVFKELDIYGEFPLRLDDFITNEELKDYITVAIEKEGLLDGMIPKADAAQVFNIEITHQRDGGYKVKVGIILEHGKESKFKVLDKHDLKFDIEFSVHLKAHSELNRDYQDIGAYFEIEMGTGFAIESHDDHFLTLKREFEEGEEMAVSFQGLTLDEEEEKKPFLQTFIALPIPGFNINYKLSLLSEFKVALEAALKAKSTMNIGFGYNSNGFYRQLDFKAEENEYSIFGKGEAKLGLETNINLNFIGILETGVNLPIGVYGEGEIGAVSSKTKKDYQGNFELGAFVSAEIYGEAKFLMFSLGKASVSYEKKMPLVELKGSTADNQGNCEEKLLNGDFSCYAGTYTYMVGGSSQKSNLVLDQEGKITGEGFSETYNRKPVSIQKEEDGTYRIEHQFYFESPSGERTLTSKYFYLAPIDVNLTYYSISGQEGTDTTKIRMKEEGFISADSNVVYQKDEGTSDSCEEKLMKKDFSCYSGSYTNKYNSNDTIILKGDGSIEKGNTAYMNTPLSCVDETSDSYPSYRCITEYKDANSNALIDKGFRIFPVGYDSGWGDINKIRLAVLKGNGADIYEKNE